jgi:hypothetical protein
MKLYLNYLSVIDSAASPANTFIAVDSTDAGNNTGWTFATTINGTASISVLATLSTVFNQNSWVDVPVGTNTWNDIG